MWKDTTDPKDPLTKHGQWTFTIEIDTLTMHFKPMHYTVRLDLFQQTAQQWDASVWIGNQGKRVADRYYSSKEEAMEACTDHLEQCATSLQAEFKRMGRWT